MTAIGKPLATLANAINSEHEAACRSVRQGLEHARHAGDLLLEAKAQVKHGEWLPWLEAHVHAKTIDRETYDSRMARENEVLALARMELHDTEVEELDVEGLLGFAAHLLTNASRLWLALDLDQKLRFQSVLFPSGVTFDGESFRTPETSSIFNYLRALSAENGNVASPTGLDQLDRVGGLFRRAA